jgi:hypothetical protein
MKFRSRLLAGFATALFFPVAVLATETAAPAKTEAATPAKEVAKQAAAPKKADANCTKMTGTRIKSSRQKDCEKASNRPLKSFTAEELASTGETDLAKALSELDPSVQ